jgi:hypothetical protein
LNMNNRVIVPLPDSFIQYSLQWSFSFPWTLCFINLSNSGHRLLVLCQHYESDISIFHNTVKYVLTFSTFWSESLYTPEMTALHNAVAFSSYATFPFLSVILLVTLTTVMKKWWRQKNRKNLMSICYIVSK